MSIESLQIILVFVTVIAVLVAFIREWISPDFIALSAMGVLLLGGVLTAGDALSVFSNSAPITVACMFILSAALERTGVVETFGQLFSKLAGRSEFRALSILLLSSAMISAFMNNTPVVVIFLPIVLAYARQSGLAASKLLIPLSYAAILGGQCTLVGTSTNLVVDGVARQYNQPPFGMFEITPLGLAFCAVGLLYMLFVGRKLLPKREPLATLLELQGHREFLTEAMITKESPLVGRTLPETPLAKMSEMKVIEVIRRGRLVLTPLNSLRFREGDLLVLKTVAAGVEGLKETTGIEVQPSEQLGLAKMQTQEAVLMEGIIGPHSRLVGRTLRELNFRQHYGVLILAVHRQGANLKRPLQDVRLAFGDTLLVEGPTEGISRLLEERDFLSLTQPQRKAYRRTKAPLAIGGIVAMSVLAAFDVMPIAALAFLATLFMVLTRCLKAEEIYRAVDWKIIFLIFGMLSLGLAMEKTGAAVVLAKGVIALAGGLGPIAVLSLLYLVATALTEVLSNNASAALLTPIAIGLAIELDVDPRPFMVAVMFASSAAFATPIGYQTNTYVYGAGGYKFVDFMKVGLPLNILLWLVATLLIPVLWPL